MTLGSLFDGIGGFPLAASRCDIKTIWASEIIKDCIEITERHFPNMLHLGDITKINGAEIPPVDIISFGSPCQNLSIAGDRKGLKGDESKLFFEAIRIIYEMREKTNGKYPTFIIWENVSGAFSSNDGNDFQKVLEEITKTDIPVPDSGKWATAGMVRSQQGTTAWRQLDAQYWGVPQRRKRIYLVHDFRGQRAGEILFKPESLLGYNQQSREQEQRYSCLLKNCPYGNNCKGLQEEIQLNLGSEGDRIYINSKKSKTLMGRGGGGAKTGLYLLDTVYTISGNVIGRNEKNGGNQTGISENISPTLTTIDRHAVYYQLAFGIFKEGIGTLTKSHAQDVNLYVKRNEVRRLTPLECERLDGFPDNWTKYGKNNREISDNQRYIALGNSIAVRIFKGITML